MMNPKSLILLDLDNTLLKNDMDRFVPVYLKKLASSLLDWPQETIIQNVLAGTRKMVENSLPSQTLEDIFDQYFYPALGIEKSAIHPKIERFYDDIFPELKYLTSSYPEVPQIVADLERFGHQLVIATNPLFPQKAVRHRLDWAGLGDFIPKFSIIASYEDFHFSKPHEEFYAEIFAQSGWPEIPALMVGDSFQDDILPCQSMGIPAYRIIRDVQKEIGPKEIQTITLGDLPKLAAHSTTLKWENTFKGIKGTLAILRSTVAALDTLVRKSLNSQINLETPDAGWNLTEIICHLRDADQEVNVPRMQRIVRGENPFLPGVITDVWAEEREYRRENLGEAFHGFLQARIGLLDMLSGLAPVEWEKPARHAIFGPTRLIELASFIATHDRSHIQQAFYLRISPCR